MRVLIAFLAVAALTIPVLAQGNTQPQGSVQGMDHSRMQGMDHSSMPGMDHSRMPRTNQGSPNPGAQQGAGRESAPQGQQSTGSQSKQR
ncbi:hypothetical protein [Roseomonas chloroacetimidivorans]|uniref:hypothetical protein n=1 Tax=Roseomonas chloroacetimidivorans TaxID=1766656 RepID=UPI003C77C297